MWKNDIVRFKAYGLACMIACGMVFLSLRLVCAQEEFVYDAMGKRNPFIALVTPDGRLLKLEQEEGEKALVLEGIIYDKSGTSYAIINGGIVKEGETVGAAKVYKIDPDRVFFIKEGQEISVILKKEEE